MTITIHPATDEHDAGVSDLFARLGIPIMPEFWARAYSPDAPQGTASRPILAVHDDGRVVGFLAASPFSLHLDADVLKSQILHDALADPAEDVTAILKMLLEEAVKWAAVSLCAGASVAITKHLATNGFHLAGHFGRYRIEPGDSPRNETDMTIPYALQPLKEFSPAIEGINHTLVSEKRVFRMRGVAGLDWMHRGPAPAGEILAAAEDSPLDAYIVLRSVDGRAGKELHVVDCACPMSKARRLTFSLAQLSKARGIPVVVSVFGDTWRFEFLDARFEELRSRWPLHWVLHSRLGRALGSALLRREAWHFTASDGAIDQWG